MFKTKQKNPGFWKNLKGRYGDKKTGVAVGFPKGGKSVGITYPDGTPVLSVAFYNEFGTETIPARPFLKIGGRKASNKLKPALRKIVPLVNEGKDLRKELGKIGLVAVSVVQKEITELDSPPNAQSTIDKKKSSNPLIDSGLMRSSVTFQVREK